MDFMQILTEALSTGTPTEAIVKREQDAMIASRYMDAFTRLLVFALAAKLLSKDEAALLVDGIHSRIVNEWEDQGLEAIAVFAKAREEITAAFDGLADPNDETSNL
jgi:hypothetical protein